MCKPRKPDLYSGLAKHFSELCRVPVTVVDTVSRAILFTENPADNFYCGKCPNRCRLLPTMLYGCNEARRWNGRYIYYCPIGLVFNAVTIPETDHAVVAGPLVMGEMQDTLLDLPDYIPKEEILSLRNCSADMLGHMASLLEMAVYGLRYRPDASAYDRNIVPGQEDPEEETAELYNSFPYMSELEGELRLAIKAQDESKARAVLNQLLRYVYSPQEQQFPLIKSRAVQLVYLLSKLPGDGGEKETAMYRSGYVPALKSAPSLEEMDAVLAEALHHFVDYTFDFSEIRRSDTIYCIMEYVKSNYSQKITLEDIASHVYLSSSYISGIFRRKTGQTISEYINHVRIEKSKWLLKQKDVSITDIAAACGFESQSYFTRVFKNQTGVSPGKYRGSAQKENPIPDFPAAGPEESRHNGGYP